MIPQDIHAVLADRFGPALLEAKLEGVHDPFLRVTPEALPDIARFLRDTDGLRFDLLMCLSGMDYTKGRLGVVYHLNSMALGHKITLKVDVPADAPHVPSVESVWKTANWHEREAFDMFGIVFDGHPDLRRMLLPEDWEGHPLRKDYQVPQYYNGMKVPY